jgi:hypothetical protein
VKDGTFVLLLVSELGRKKKHNKGICLMIVGEMVGA